MKRLLYSAKAREDLRDILTHIAQDKPSVALAFVEQLAEKARLLMTFPEAGESRPDLIAGLRVLAHRGYGIYYQVDADAVTVERVLAPGLDVSNDLFG